MDWLIYAKWLTDFTGRENQAPSIITIMINMALNGGAYEPGTIPVIGKHKAQ